MLEAAVIIFGATTVLFGLVLYKHLMDHKESDRKGTPDA